MGKPNEMTGRIHAAIDNPDPDEAEIAAAFAWYQERNPQAAQAFRAETFDAIDSLADSAMNWKQDDDGVHRFVLRHFPYTVFYEMDGQVVSVLAVAHQRRRPGYWRDR